MKLLYQTHSPFARKTLVFAHEAGLANQIEVIHHETSPTQRNDQVFMLNPLGKVPVLISDDENTIFESSVICEFFESLNNGEELIPSGLPERLSALKLQSIADGMSEAGILARWESPRRPKQLRYPPYLNGQLRKISSAYTFIEEKLELPEKINIGHIALATAISWLEFREVALIPRDCPRLLEWYNEFKHRDSMISTTLSGDTHD